MADGGASEPPEITPEEVLDRVAAAGGHLVLPDLEPDELAAWRHAARTAQLRLLRAGTARLSKWTSGNTLRISVVDPSAPPKPISEVTSEPPAAESRDHSDFVGRSIRVPSKLPKVLHSLVVEMQDGMTRLEADRWRPYHSRRFVPDWIPDVPRQKSGRMLRIWQAILDEAGFRGYRVWAGGQRGEYVTLEAGPDYFRLTSGGSQNGLWLRLRAEEHQRNQKNLTWSDTESKPLEQQLGAMFDRLELMIKAAVERREDEARQAAERRRRWEAAMSKARAQFAEQHRKDALRKRVEEAATAEDIQAYAAALRSSAETVDPSRRDDVVAWATWAQTYADEIDPVRNQAGMPATPEPGRDDLAPYLHGWSPWGPS
ncbi:hypothetical protein [Amycolatopsis sp. NPDC052450]|uniref:hypothetical protein n=1 Tax=Amycolatopsis sp. NPDC052450 TaxID=3363937 RepID=UPI0037CBC687